MRKISIKPLIIALAICGMLTTSHAGVISHYTFDSDYTDSSGNGNDGTFVDVGTTGDSGITTTAGEFKFGGGGLHLTEDRDYVAVDELTFSSTSGPYSFAFWARRANITDQWAMILGDQSDGADFIALRNDNILRQRGANLETIRQHDYAVTSDTDWHHYVVTGDAGGFGTGTMSLYLDGSLVEAVGSRTTGFTLNAIGAAYTASNNFDFEGQIDEVWVFDEVIDSATVGSLYNTNVIPEPATLSMVALFGGGLLFIRRRLMI